MALIVVFENLIIRRCLTSSNYMLKGLTHFSSQTRSVVLLFYTPQLMMKGFGILLSLVVSVAARTIGKSHEHFTVIYR
jgi:hypothetical protein